MENEINVLNSTSLETRIETIESHVVAITQADLFLVAFLVVCVVCFLLYKAVDNFISF